VVGHHQDGRGRIAPAMTIALDQIEASRADLAAKTLDPIAGRRKGARWRG
jgi:hypothetical protein